MDLGKSKSEFLRHTVATLAYRGGKSLKDAPEHFADFKIGETTKTPLQILAHICDLLDWALWMAKGEHRWSNTTPDNWNKEVERFFEALKNLDNYLASSTINTSTEEIFQGPIADALTHVGQINLLRRLDDSPVRGENYYKAEIETGRVGANQSSKRIEFD